MKYNKKILKAEFISRPNRFNAIVKLNEEEYKALEDKSQYHTINSLYELH